MTDNDPGLSGVIVEGRRGDLSELLDGAQIPIVESDKRMVITHSNAAAEIVFGYGRGELVGQRFNVLMLPFYSKEHDECIAAYESTGVKKILTTVGCKVKGVRKDGGELSLKLTTSTTKYGYAAVFVDVTAEIKIETALEVVKAKTETQMHLLSQVLPEHIVQKLLRGEHAISESHESATIVFSDIVKWTNIAAALPTRAVIKLLNHLFSAFDELSDVNGIFKVRKHRCLREERRR